MSEFKEEYKRGQKGFNTGLYMGDGVHKLSQALSGVQRRHIYVVAGAPKAGKTTLVDYAFFLEPYLDSLNDPSIDVEWIYYSLEMDRVTKEFDFAAYFLHRIYDIYEIKLPKGVLYKKEKTIILSSDYLLGVLKDDDGNIIKVNKDLEELLFNIHKDYIEPLVGKYNAKGVLTKSGKATFIEHSDNPTGTYKSLLDHARYNGTIVMSEGKYPRMINFIPNNPKKYTIIIYDHVRKALKETGKNMKDTIDKLSEYQVILRNLLGYTFVNIVHMNRNISSMDSLKLYGDNLQPTPESLKDTGNMSEDGNVIIGIFSPNDDRYNLETHFGMKIRDSNWNLMYPFYKTIHIMEARRVEAPQHFRVDMNGAVKVFRQFVKLN